MRYWPRCRCSSTSASLVRSRLMKERSIANAALMRAVRLPASARVAARVFTAEAYALARRRPRALESRAGSGIGREAGRLDAGDGAGLVLVGHVARDADRADDV